MGNVHGLDTYRALLDLGEDYDISAKEVEETILRVMLRKLGRTKECKCKSRDIVVRPGTKYHRPHCRKCWRFSEMLGKPGGSYAGRFNVLISDFEKDLHEVLVIDGKLGERRQQPLLSV